ncbi:MAG: hypothetical protein KC978_19405, partial [Candidatus Omnitrophica bacterium]|nr:hypothetical protein [Candidatus Omnitrophota bacterium]
MPYKFLFLTFALIWSQTPVRAEAEIEFANPGQFLASKESDLVAILKTTSVRNVFLLDEDITPALVSECVMEEAIDGSKSWPSGTKQTLAQWDACSSPMDPAAPPILEGRRYLVWAHRTPNGLSNVSFDWFALPDGCFLIRDHPKGAFIYWEGNCYLVAEIRKSLGSIGGQDLPREHEPNVASEKSNSPYTQGFSQKASDVEESPKGSPPVDPTQIENVRQLLGNPDPEERAQGLVQAGILGLDEFYENIKKTALNGDQTERLAAISSLGFYDRPLETEYLNRLIGNDEDLMVKLSALEL